VGTFDTQQFMDTFGGLPDRDEAAVDPRELADLQRDERDAMRDARDTDPGWPADGPSPEDVYLDGPAHRAPVTLPVTRADFLRGA